MAKKVKNPEEIKTDETKKEVVKASEIKKTTQEKILMRVVLAFSICFVVFCVAALRGILTGYNDMRLYIPVVLFLRKGLFFLLMFLSLFFANISAIKKNPKIRAKYWVKTFFVILGMFLLIISAEMIVDYLTIADYAIADYELSDLFGVLFIPFVLSLFMFLSLLLIGRSKKKSQTRKIWIFVVTLLLVSLLLVAGTIAWDQMRHRPGFGCGGYFGDDEWEVFSKPIIYLYPESKTDVSVKLGKPENLTHTYPKYQEGWRVTAEPNGDLTDDKGRHYYALYWEGMQSEELKSKDGFIVKGTDTIPFLEEKLALLGLNEREANEFIVYWLPELESNEYNFIRFETAEEIETNMPLYIEPQPDIIVRVMMEFRSAKETEQVQEQKLSPTPNRKGFIVVEWGGTRLK